MITAMAKGADRAVVVDDSDFVGADCLGVSRVLTAVAQKEGVEVLFCGKQSMDGDNAQVPSMLGELLDWATVPVISNWK